MKEFIVAALLAIMLSLAFICVNAAVGDGLIECTVYDEEIKDGHDEEGFTYHIQGRAPPIGG